MPSPLVQRLQTIAAQAIAAEEQALAYDATRLRGVTIELEFHGGAAPPSGRCWVERKVRMADLTVPPGSPPLPDSLP